MAATDSEFGDQARLKGGPFSYSGCSWHKQIYDISKLTEAIVRMLLGIFYACTLRALLHGSFYGSALDIWSYPQR